MAKRYHEGKSMKAEMKHAGGMISEDHSACCLLPRGVIQKDFPKASYSHEASIKDLFHAVQEQMGEDERTLSREKPRKY